MISGPLIVDIASLQLDDEDREVLAHPLVGGVILFARNAVNMQQLACLAGDIKGLKDPPLWVCVDQEGGRVQRFRQGFSRLPALYSLGRLYEQNKSKAVCASRALARLMAWELSQAGIDFSFAPVVDRYDAASEVIADRAFHASPEVVSQLAAAYMRGLHDIGMIAVAKHFPGHGGVVQDSHRCMPEDYRCYKRIMASDLLPYRRLIGLGLNAVMCAHVRFPRVDERLPGFSPFWVRQILRGVLKFKGVIFSDDLSMQATADFGPMTQRVMASLTAGCDFVLICNARDDVLRVLDDAGVMAAARNKSLAFSGFKGQARMPNWRPNVQQYQQLMAELESVL